MRLVNTFLVVKYMAALISLTYGPWMLNIRDVADEIKRIAAKHEPTNVDMIYFLDNIQTKRLKWTKRFDLIK